MGRDEYTLLPFDNGTDPAKASARVGHQGMRKMKQALAILTAIAAATLLWATMSTSSFSSSPANPPFKGPFSLIPRISDLPVQSRRLTAYTLWNGDSYRDYLRHFLFSAQLNSDSLDVVFINLRNETSGQCLNFADYNVDITWGNNIHQLCIGADDWKQRHVDFFCHETHGWGCTSKQRAKVDFRMGERLAKNKKNAFFRPFLPYLVEDLVPSFESTFWAWMDMVSVLHIVLTYCPACSLPSCCLIPGRICTWDASHDFPLMSCLAPIS